MISVFNNLVTESKSLFEVSKAIRNEFSCIVFTSEDIKSIPDDLYEVLRNTQVRYYGHQTIFVMSMELLKDFFQDQNGAVNLELEDNMVHILRKEEPFLLEMMADFEQPQHLWNYFEEYRYENLKGFTGFPDSEKFHLLLFNGNCTEDEEKNVLIWNSFKENDIFGSSYRLCNLQEPHVYNTYKKAWNIKSECAAVFVKKINDITFDKFLVESDFIGKFTIDDFTNKLKKGKAKNFIVSQKFSDLKGEEGYRLVANNIDSTSQEMANDLVILLYTHNHNDYDLEFKDLRDNAEEECGKKNTSKCFEPNHNVIPVIQSIQDFKLKLFSINLSLNDLPGFVIDHSPTLLFFKQGEDSPREAKLTNLEQIPIELEKYIEREKELLIDLEL